MLLWTSTVHADKRVAIARAIRFYDDQRKVLIFVLETGEMWEEMILYITSIWFHFLPHLWRICRDIESGKEDWRKVLKSGM